MTFRFAIDDLLAYTEWDREQWHAWFTGQPDALALGLGSNSDGRLKDIGELVRHIFAAEQRYVDRIRGAALFDAAGIPTNDVDALFAFGSRTRAAMRALLAELPQERWDAAQEIQLGPNKMAVTPKTMAVQAVTHEIRHWSQLAMLLRIEGRKTGAHDFLVSGVYAGAAARV